MNTPEVKEIDYVKAWAAFFFCASIVGAITGAIIGGILGVVLSAAGIAVSTIKLAAGGAGFLIGIPISYFFFRLFVSLFLIRKLSAPHVSGDAPKIT